MKSLIKITAIISAAIIFSVNLYASSFNFTGESYTNDIPCKTKEVSNDIMADQQLAKFTFEEEEYIDDIPFNTVCISTNCLYQKAISVEFSFDEEQFIDDI